MIKHNLQQGTPEWHQFRSRHFGASEASAMLGLSDYTTRTELLHEKHSGIGKDHSEATMMIFSRGHETEASARPIMEELIGEDLYPVTCSDGNLSCSCDGLTMCGEIAFEHKQWNQKLAESVSNGVVPESHLPQCQQILLVTGAQKVIFTVSDGTPANFVYTEVLPDQAWFERIRAGWAQFEKDIAVYVPVEIAEKPKAEVTIELPALFVHAKGEITTHNMEAYGTALTAKLVEVRAIKLITDQDFSNAKAAAAMFREQCKKLMLTKEAMLSQTVTIGEASRMMDAWHEDLRQTALQLEKDVEREDLAKKRVMLSDTATAYSAHIEALEAEIRPIKLDMQRPNFAEAIKNKRNYTSMQGALDDALTNGKMLADAAAKDIRDKLAWFDKTVEPVIGQGSHRFLFADLQQIIIKPMDDFKLLVTTRIDKHKADEVAKIERIRAEEQVKAEAAAKAKIEHEAAEKLKAEQVAFDAAAQREHDKALAGEAAVLQPAEPVVDINATRAVVEHQDEIAAFLALRDFGKDAGRIRAILVEFVKFQATNKLKIAA